MREVVKVDSTFPDDTVYIEIRGIYDGWSVALLPDGSMRNRWHLNDRRHRPTQDWIDIRAKSEQPAKALEALKGGEDERS